MTADSAAETTSPRLDKDRTAGSRGGLAYGIGAYTFWGFVPLYWTLVTPSGPWEILAHRVAWSLLIVVLLLTLARRWGAVRAALRQPRLLGFVTLAAIAISVNWGTFIYGVTHDQVVDVALGYFITPLVAVLLGVTVLRERLRIAQWSALAVGTSAVVVLATAHGGLPIVALALGLSFGFYSLVKKRVNLGTVESLALETAVLAPAALVFLAVLIASGRSTVGAHGTGHLLAIAGTGLVTAIPLLLFGAAATRLSLASIGVLQYLTPTVQLILGIVVFAEPMSPARWLGFGLVWIGLAIFTVDALARRRRELADAARATAL